MWGVAKSLSAKMVNTYMLEMRPWIQWHRSAWWVWNGALAPDMFWMGGWCCGNFLVTKNVGYGGGYRGELLAQRWWKSERSEIETRRRYKERPKSEVVEKKGSGETSCDDSQKKKKEIPGRMRAPRRQTRTNYQICTS